jgi:electron transfer flavoprotein beta subunit
VTLPAIITTDLRLNEPRYVSLSNIMKAKKKPLDRLGPETLDVDISPRLRVLRWAEPSKRQAGVRLADAAELADKLRSVARVV